MTYKLTSDDIREHSIATKYEKRYRNYQWEILRIPDVKCKSALRKVPRKDVVTTLSKDAAARVAGLEKYFTTAYRLRIP